MTKKVLAAVLVSHSRIVMREFDKPEIGRDEGLLKVEMVGVCATDANFYTGKLKIDYPVILGHESIGTIAEIGDIASKRWKVKEGDRIVTETFIRCGFCRECLAGNYRMCEDRRFYGAYTPCSIPPYLWGEYAEYTYLAPGAVVHKISDKVPAKAGVLVNGVLSNGIRWGRLSGGYCIGDAVAIIGIGQQGLMQVIAAKESGCNPIIVVGLTKDTQRFELAKEFGATHAINVENEDLVQRVREITGGRMADIVVHVTSNPSAIPVCVDLVRERGTVVLAGEVGDVAVPIMQDKVVRKELKIIGQRGSDAHALDLAIVLAESGKYPIEKVVSHTFALREAEKAVQTAAGYFKDVYPTKCVIVP